MSEHGYCFLMSFLGSWAAITLLVVIAKIQKAVSDFCRSDWERFNLDEVTSKLKRTPQENPNE